MLGFRDDNFLSCKSPQSGRFGEIQVNKPLNMKLDIPKCEIIGLSRDLRLLGP